MATIVVALLAALVVAPATAVGGVLKGTAAGTESVSSGSWGASVAPTSLTWTSNSSQTATVTNTGTIALVQLTYQITVTFDAAKDNPVLTLAVCTSAWSGGKCNGGAGTNIPANGNYDVNGTTTETSTVVPPLSGHVYLQATSSGTFRQSQPLTMAFVPEVAGPSQLRAAVKTDQ
ncbi:MAG TPA: hypothetical protein VMB72_16720 [Acidimicrobiales bacterium]|nr:hypothetical protein [Acidimicrobiales bacterium]